MELLIYTTPVAEGDYFLECGFRCDMIGHIYYKSEDENGFYDWFKKHMYKKGWTLTCGGPANPYCPEYNSKGEFFNKVYSIKRHYEDKGKKGTLGHYKRILISVDEKIKYA